MTESPLETDRQALIERHVRLVGYIARRMATKLPEWEHEDLESYGYFGLIDAARRFDIDSYDPERGVTFDAYFEGFATPRIRGAILDGLRAKDWAPRSVRALVRSVEGARDDLHSDLGREPTPAELAAHLGIDEAEVREALREAHESHVQPMHTRSAGTNADDHTESAEHPPHLPSSDIAAEAEQGRLTALVAQAIALLPEGHRQFVALRYGEELTLPQVGERMGLSRGKTTTLYVESCLRLREHLAMLA